MKEQNLDFDPVQHKYTLNGAPVPNVTRIINAVLPQWQVDQWYLDRGRANHACYAMIAKDEAFTCDPACDGFVIACRKFFREVQPKVLAVEWRVCSQVYRYAGTLDLACVIQGRNMIVDYKGTLTPATKYQLAAYAGALSVADSVAMGKFSHGLGVEMHEDGTYKMSDVYDLRKHINGFLAMRTVYNIINNP